MAKITTEIEHTIVLTEEERLVVVGALRYKQSRVTQWQELDVLIAVLTQEGALKDG